MVDNENDHNIIMFLCKQIEILYALSKLYTYVDYIQVLYSIFFTTIYNYDPDSNGHYIPSVIFLLNNE